MKLEMLVTKDIPEFVRLDTKESIKCNKGDIVFIPEIQAKAIIRKGYGSLGKCTYCPWPGFFIGEVEPKDCFGCSCEINYTKNKTIQDFL